MGDCEFIDKVSFGAHDLDAIEPRCLRVFGGFRKILDSAADIGIGHLARNKAVDRGADRAWGDAALDFCIAPGVQKLRANQTAFGLDRLADRTQAARVLRVVNTWPFGIEHALGIGRKSARNQNRRLSPRPFGVKGNLPRNTVGLGFQPGMHRAHDDTISQHVLPCAYRRKHGSEAFLLHVCHCEDPPKTPLDLYSNIC